MKFPSNNSKTKTHKQKKNIYILLTKFDDGGAKFLRTLTGCYYTHSSIGLEEDMNTFYSFAYKGFIVEQITRYIKPDKNPYPCELYRLEVCEKTYKRVKKMLRSFVEAKNKFRYTRLGVARCLLGIPHKEKLSYFCSYFVADVLKKCGAVCIEKNSSLYLPGDFRKFDKLKLDFKGNLLTFAQHFGILPYPAY